MSIQPVNKAADHIWLIQHWYWKKKKERKKEEEQEKQNKKKQQQQQKAVNAYLIKNSRGKGEGGTITSSRKDWAEYYVTVRPM